MIQFLSPILLLLSLSVLIPIVIHLLSRRRGKTLKIGSVKLIAESQSSKFKNLKLSEVMLLLLRTTLLILLALLLAKPYWIDHKSINESEGKHWVLISPEILDKINDSSINTKIDSLISNGYEPHLFDSKFPKINWNVKDEIDQSLQNYWSLLREADSILPPGSQLVVFAPNQLKYFRGERPQLNSEYTWYPIESEKSQWIEKAKIHKDKLLVTLGFSDSSKTFFREYEFEIPRTPRIFSGNNMPPVEVVPDLKREEIRIRIIQASNDYSDVFRIQTNPSKRVVQIFYEEDRVDDANYVRAAVEAVEEIIKIPISISMLGMKDFEKVTNSPELIFWLSSEEIPGTLKNFTQDGATLITDMASNEYEISTGKMIMAGQTTNEEPRIWRYSKVQNQNASIWTDVEGNPLLQFESLGLGEIYRFHSRFHPQWNELVVKPQFPEWIMNVLLKSLENEGMENPKRIIDRRNISINQLSPQKIIVANDMRQKENKSDLTIFLWLIVLSLFGFERWISERRKTNESST